MYFSDQFRMKKSGDFLIISFRVNEKKVDEHKVLIEKADVALSDSVSDDWYGSSVFRVKKSGNSVFLKFHTNVYRADIYCLTLAEFRMLKSLYLSIRGI